MMKDLQGFLFLSYCHCFLSVVIFSQIVISAANLTVLHRSSELSHGASVSKCQTFAKCEGLEQHQVDVFF